MSRHLLVIGAQRCGTTYLASLLESHPDITMARPARPEPKVFLSDDILDRGRDWYVRTYFSHATGETVLAEKSTSYIEDPEAPARAAQLLGDADILVLLRDPVERAVSNWQLSTENGFDTRPVEVALRENLARGRSWDSGLTSVSPFAYLERGRYADYLDPWFSTFPCSTHVHFLPEIRDDDAALSDMFGSLGVDPAFRPADRSGRVNRSRDPSPVLSEELVARMREYFDASDRALSRRLGRELPWPTGVGRGAANA